MTVGVSGKSVDPASNEIKISLFLGDEREWVAEEIVCLGSVRCIHGRFR